MALVSWLLADVAGLIEWSVDSTIARAHQHATTVTRRTGAGPNYTNLIDLSPSRLIMRSAAPGAD